MNEELQHVKLSTIATSDISSPVKKAADDIADAGGSPRAQIDAARAVSGKRLQYVAHQGMRQRERALARMNKEKKND